jgi:menaquinone-dependent protoporphyrinogen IX oxidase
MVEWLNDNSFEAHLINIKDDQWPVLSQYQGLILGTGIKIGQWTKEMKNFIKKRNNEINNFAGPKVFFVCSGYAAIPERYQEIKEEYCLKALTKLGVSMDDYEAFGGVMDVSPTSNVGWLNKQIIKAVDKQSINFDPKGINDYRDWVKIEEFTKNFIQRVKEKS